MQYLGGNMDEECSNFVSKFDIFTKIWASTKGTIYGIIAAKMKLKKKSGGDKNADYQ